MDSLVRGDFAGIFEWEEARERETFPLKTKEKEIIFRISTS